jgi:hypothetical protein
MVKLINLSILAIFVKQRTYTKNLAILHGHLSILHRHLKMDWRRKAVISRPRGTWIMRIEPTQDSVCALRPGLRSIAPPGLVTVAGF